MLVATFLTQLANIQRKELSECHVDTSICKSQFKSCERISESNADSH